MLYIPGAGAGFPKPTLLGPQGSVVPSREVEFRTSVREGAKGGAALMLETGRSHAGCLCQLQFPLLAQSAPQLFSTGLPEPPGGDPGLCLVRGCCTVMGTGSRWGVGGSRGGHPIEKGAHREGLDGPHDLAVLGDPLDTPHRRLELGGVGIIGHRDVDLHVVGRRPPLELALGLEMRPVTPRLWKAEARQPSPHPDCSHQCPTPLGLPWGLHEADPESSRHSSHPLTS